jgi:hypothetical protein
MQIGESIALELTSIHSKLCPMEPHDEHAGFRSKPIKQKDVDELRSNMESGKSTRKWVQQGDGFALADNFDASKKPHPTYAEEPIRVGVVKFKLAVAAHHLIPGEASLPATALRKYIWSSEGTIKSDIGYDVDGAENGIWLPTHMAVSTKMKDRILVTEQGVVINNNDDHTVPDSLSWRQLSNRAKKKVAGVGSDDADQGSFTELFVRRYTQQSMKLLGCQFHDAHSKYNLWVKERLDSISKHLDDKVKLCEKCKVTPKGPFPPPYALVYKLNMLSHLIAGVLSGRPRRVWAIIYTSSHAVQAYTHPLSQRHDLYGDDPPR